jgi:hypothetical protein
MACGSRCAADARATCGAKRHKPRDAENRPAPYGRSDVVCDGELRRPAGLALTFGIRDKSAMGGSSRLNLGVQSRRIRGTESPIEAARNGLARVFADREICKRYSAEMQGRILVRLLLRLQTPSSYGVASPRPG